VGCSPKRGLSERIRIPRGSDRRKAPDARQGSARSSAANGTARWAVPPSEDCLSTAPLPRIRSRAAGNLSPAEGIYSIQG